MMERNVVSKESLKAHGMTFRMDERVKYEGDDDAFMVRLTHIESGESIRWLQGDDDLDYNFFRNYRHDLMMKVKGRMV